MGANAQRHTLKDPRYGATITSNATKQAMHLTDF
jgi:hypothetical protein